MEKDRIEVICIGGRYSAKSHSFIGPLSERSLDNYHVHKAFISCKGVHITNGVRDSSELQALLKRQMIAHCEEAILMVDNSKVNAHSFSHIAPSHLFTQLYVMIKLIKISNYKQRKLVLM